MLWQWVSDVAVDGAVGGQILEVLMILEAPMILEALTELRTSTSHTRWTWQRWERTGL